MSSREPWRAARAHLLIALGLVLVGALGAWPSPATGGDPVAALAWLAVLAPGAGALASGLGLAPVPLGWLVPVLWTAPVLWASSSRGLPTLHWALLAWTGLYLAGAAAGEVVRRRGGSAWGASAIVLLLAGALALLPGRGAAGARPWPPPLASAGLDLSPSALVVESAGVDWMRHAAVYDPVGTDRFERRPWRGALAGPVALVLGCALAAAARLVARREPRDA